MRLSLATGSALLLALPGCAPTDPHYRQPVSGLVTVDGRPVPYGNIEFAPAEGQPTALILEVRDGRFAVAAKGGLSPGKYVVRVQGMDGPPPPPGDTPGTFVGPMPKSIVPAKYGARSQETVVIRPEDKNELTLDLKN
ncbi:MAG: hypothetical protein C0501_04315 [Isosphaera sp.]|nr:hypothetical protein [Isosphaera sp.]